MVKTLNLRGENASIKHFKQLGPKSLEKKVGTV